MAINVFRSGMLWSTTVQGIHLVLNYTLLKYSEKDSESDNVNIQPCLFKDKGWLKFRIVLRSLNVTGQ